MGSSFYFGWLQNLPQKRIKQIWACDLVCPAETNAVFHFDPTLDKLWQKTPNHHPVMLFSWFSPMFTLVMLFYKLYTSYLKFVGYAGDWIGPFTSFKCLKVNQADCDSFRLWNGQTTWNQTTLKSCCIGINKSKVFCWLEINYLLEGWMFFLSFL